MARPWGRHPSSMMLPQGGHIGILLDLLPLIFIPWWREMHLVREMHLWREMHLDSMPVAPSCHLGFQIFPNKNHFGPSLKGPKWISWLPSMSDSLLFLIVMKQHLFGPEISCLQVCLSVSCPIRTYRLPSWGAVPQWSWLRDPLPQTKICSVEMETLAHTYCIFWYYIMKVRLGVSTSKPPNSQAAEYLNWWSVQ